MLAGQCEYDVTLYLKNFLGKNISLQVFRLPIVSSLAWPCDPPQLFFTSRARIGSVRDLHRLLAYCDFHALYENLRGKAIRWEHSGKKCEHEMEKRSGKNERKCRKKCFVMTASWMRVFLSLMSVPLLSLPCMRGAVRWQYSTNYLVSHQWDDDESCIRKSSIEMSVEEEKKLSTRLSNYSDDEDNNGELLSHLSSECTQLWAWGSAVSSVSEGRTLSTHLDARSDENR